MLPETLAFYKTHRRCACILFSAGHKWEKVVFPMKKWETSDLLCLKRKFSLNRKELTNRSFSLSRNKNK